MGKLFRRALAFVLGMVFGVTALVGSVVGGAYWAYKNVKPLELVNKEEEKIAGLGELESASIEELLDLIGDAVNNPDEYKIKRLEKEYGLDLASLLKSVGIDTENASSVDMDAIRDVSLFSIVNGSAAFLDGIKVRALYVFLPKLIDKPIDELLSSEAQAKLGDYSLLDFFSKDELTEEAGFVSALKNLKLGSILPAKFDSTYDRATHEYIYTLKEGEPENALGLLGNVYIGTLFDIMNGSPIIDEIMEGGLESIGDLTLYEILVTVAGSASSDMKDFVEKRAKAFGDAKISDLFEKVDGEYKFTLDNVSDKIEVGYVLGYYKGEDGLWYQDEACTITVDGVKNAIASANVKELLENKDDTLALIKAAFGDVEIGEFINTLGMEGRIPEGMKALFTVTVGDIIGEEGSDIITNMRKEFSRALGDTTLQEFLGITAENKVLENVYQIKVGDLIKPGATGEEILSSIQNALNGIAVGELLGYVRDGEGNWNCENEYLKPILDVTFGEAPAGLSLLVLLSIFSEGGITEIGQALFGDLKVGDAFAVIFKYDYDENERNWYKSSTEILDDGETEVEVREYLDPDFGEAMHMKLWEMLSAFDKNSDYVMYEDLKELSIGETLFSLLSAIDRLPSGFIAVDVDEYQYLEGMTEDGYALENEDARQLSEILFQIDLEEFRLHRKDKQYWLDKLMPVKAQSLLGMFLSEEQENANAFIKGTLSVTVGEFIELTDTTDDKSGKQVLSDMINKHYKTVELNGVETVVYMGDLFELLTPDWRNNCTMETIGNLEFAKSACAILGTESKREAFGHLTLGQLGSDYVPERLQKSDFVQATLLIDLNGLIDIYRNRNESLKTQIKFAFEHVFEPVYDGLTIMDCIDDFRNFGEKLESYGPILDFELDDIMRALRTGEYGTLLDDFKTAFKQLEKKEKIVVLGGAGVGVLALYEFDNEILVKLIGDVFEDATWGDYLATRFGYEMGADGNYTISGVYNPLADKLLKQEMRVTFDKTKCSIRKEYIEQVTFGEMLASHKKLISYVEKANELGKIGTLSSDDEGIYLKGRFDRLSKVIFSIKPIDVYRNRNNVKGFIVDTFGDVTLGDVGAGIMHKGLETFGIEHDYKVVDGKYIVSGAFKNVSQQFYNTTLYDFYKQRKALVKDIIKSANVGDVLADVVNFASDKYLGNAYNGKAVLSSDGTTWEVSGDYDEILSVLYNLNIGDAMSGFKADGKAYFGKDETFGKVKLGYLFAKGNNEWVEEKNAWFDKNGKPCEFVGTDGLIRKTIYKLTFGDVLSGNFKFDSVLEGLYLGEFIGYTCSLDSVGHVHSADCEWYEEIDAFVVGEEDLGPQKVIVKLKSLDQTISSLELKSLLDGGFSLKTIFEDCKLGDVIGLKAVETSDGDVWYKYAEVGGYNVCDKAEFGERITESEPATNLAQALSEIHASELTKPTATTAIIEKVKALKIGDALEYVAIDESGITVWYKKEADKSLTKVSGLMQKLANHTITELEGDLDGIVHDWTLQDVLSSEQIGDNTILIAVKDIPLDEISTEIEKVEFGTVMGYEKKGDTKWYKKNGTVVDDEIALVLCDYKVGELTGAYEIEDGKTFTQDVVSKMLDNVTLKTIYPNAGQTNADGFMSVLEPDWKLGELSQRLMDKLKTATTIQELISLGVFGDYLVASDGYTDATMPAKIYNDQTGKDEYNNYGLLDTIFVVTAPDDMGVREYWLSLSMPEFMSSIMATVTEYQKWFIENAGALAGAGIQLPNGL